LRHTSLEILAKSSLVSDLYASALIDIGPMGLPGRLPGPLPTLLVESLPWIKNELKSRIATDAIFRELLEARRSINQDKSPEV
jgi:hypothetical protein